MSSATAVNILIEPDEATRARARELNARLRLTMPEGFGLDATHVPHITVLQRYVRTPELEQALDAVDAVVAGADLSTLTLHASAIAHAEWETPGTGMASLMLGREPRLLDTAGPADRRSSAPFAAPGGTAAAFVTDAEEPGINATTIGYVARFVPDHCASHYEAHLSIGMARRRDLEALEAEPFEPFDVQGRGRRRVPAREQRDGPSEAEDVAAADEH